MFFGCKHHFGYCPITISSIRMIKTATNYQGIIRAIAMFDAILNDNISTENKLSASLLNNSIPILTHLCNYGSNRNEDRKFDDYIYQTWSTFINNKTIMKVDMRGVNKDLLALIFDASTNIVKLSMFPNLTEIKTVNGGLRVSLLQLAELLKKNSNITKIEIEGHSSWIRDEWSQRVKLSQEYGNAGYNIDCSKYEEEKYILTKHKQSVLVWCLVP